MAGVTGIAWCDHTYNIAWGCMKVSPGCANCYADTLSRRYGFAVWGPAATTRRRTFGPKHWHDPRRWHRAAEQARERRRVFCSSMADVFEDHPTIDAERAKLWPLIRETPWLDWQLLTKRPERIAGHLPPDWGDGYPNVWLGTSVESQPYAASRLRPLLAVPAVVHFVSCEPLLGPVDLSPWLAGGARGEPVAAGRAIGWVIVGGESGPWARPMDEADARSLIAQCKAAGVPVFLKQLGGRGDKRAGAAAVLDGRWWTEMPSPAAPEGP